MFVGQYNLNGNGQVSSLCNKQWYHYYFLILILFFPKVFAESLLCSGQVDNIHLASQVLTLTPDECSTRRQGPPYKNAPKEPGTPVSSFKSFTFHLPYDESCNLVVNAAKEYFNSAGSLLDKDMDLARCNTSCSIVSPACKIQGGAPRPV